MPILWEHQTFVNCPHQEVQCHMSYTRDSAKACSGYEYCVQVYTAGGGSKNPAWIRIREKKLGVPVVASTQAQAAYGSALLAQQGAAKTIPTS